MAIRMSAKEARDKFSDVLGRAYYKNEPTIVEKQGKPMAVVISLEQYERYRQQETQELFAAIHAIDERMRDADPAEIEAEIEAAVADVRQEKHVTDSPRRA